MSDPGLRAVFAGDRGRLLVGLLFAELGTAIQAVAEAAVLPLASHELHGAALYGATVAGPALSAILFAILGPPLTRRLGPRGVLLWSTLVYLAGVLLAVLAPTMAFLLAGRLLQGAAAGLLAAFGLNAVGALYEDAVRARVVAIFSVVWLLPSVLGPAVNAIVASLAGWRWAMAWPAVLVIAARIVIGRRAGLLPTPERGAATPVASGVVVLAALALAAAAPGLPVAARVPVWAAALAVALAAGYLVVRRLTGGQRRRMLGIGIFAGITLAYFAGEALLPLGLIDVSGLGVTGASIAFAAGAASWSIAGLRPAGERMRPVVARIGAALITAAAVALAVVTFLAVPGPAALRRRGARLGIGGRGHGEQLAGAQRRGVRRGGSAGRAGAVRGRRLRAVGGRRGRVAARRRLLLGHGRHPARARRGRRRVRARGRRRPRDARRGGPAAPPPQPGSVAAPRPALQPPG